MIEAIAWLIALELLAIFVFPICFMIFRRFPDRGQLLSKVLGVLLFSYITWLLSSLHLFKFSLLSTVLAVLIMIVLFLVFYLLQKEQLKEFFATKKKQLIGGEIVFLIIFSVFLVIRAFNPEIFWGEKPMDFAILNSILRSDYLPPYEAWAAGNQLNYYYFGHFVVASLTKLTQLPASFTYNLAVATVPTFLFIGTTSLVAAMTKKMKYGLLAGLFVCLLGNIEGVYLLFKGRIQDFGFFWDTSRIIPSGINEYPLWTTLFADLHAHFLVLPFMILSIALIWVIFEDIYNQKLRPRVLSMVTTTLLTSLAIGSLFVTNLWNWPVVVTFLVIITKIYVLFVYRGSVARRIATFIKKLFYLATIIFLSLALFTPYYQNFKNTGAGYGWEFNAATNLRQIFAHWGIFFCIILFYYLYTFIKNVAKHKVAGILSILLMGGFIAISVISAQTGLVKELKNPIDGLIFCLFAFSLLTSWQAEKRVLFAKGLVTLGLVMILFSQVYFLADKMNTIFKIYSQAWVIFGIAAALLLFETKKVMRTNPLVFRILYNVAVVLLVAAGLTTTVIDLKINSTTTHVNAKLSDLKRPQLDGMYYLKVVNPSDYEAINWLNSHVSGSPVLLEAQKMSYAEYMRISMNTGLPVPIGWDYHVKQRGITDAEINARKDATTTIFDSNDMNAVKSAIATYHVQYIYVGQLEKQTYPSLNPDKFNSIADVVYSNDKVKIYKVKE